MPTLYEGGPNISDEEWRVLVNGQQQADAINAPTPGTVGNQQINRAISSIGGNVNTPGPLAQAAYNRQKWLDELRTRHEAAQAWRQTD